MMIFGVLTLLAAVILMITGQMWALVLFLVGFGMIAAHAAKMFKGAGYETEGMTAFMNGLNGQGQQQSEVSKK